MNPRPFFRMFRPLAAGVWALAFVSVASAQSESLDLTGTYGDKGTIVSAAEGPTSGEISFHGLLDFAFNPAVNLALHPESSDVVFTQQRRELIVKILRDNGEPTKEDWWNFEERQTATGRCLVVGFPDPTHADRLLYFILQPVASGRLLSVQVVRTIPSALGPGTKEVGTYYFPRDS